VAWDKAINLSPDQKIRIGLRQKEYAKQWDAAADIYHSLWNNQSDNLFYALELARCQMEGNHLKESLATLQLLKGKSVPSAFRHNPIFVLPRFKKDWATTRNAWKRLGKLPKKLSQLILPT